MTDKNDKVGEQNDNELLQGSKSDPQKTEMEGLKKGGVEPVVHPGDKEDAPKKPARSEDERQKGSVSTDSDQDDASRS